MVEKALRGCAALLVIAGSLQAVTPTAKALPKTKKIVRLNYNIGQLLFGRAPT